MIFLPINIFFRPIKRTSTPSPTHDSGVDVASNTALNTTSASAAAEVTTLKETETQANFRRQHFDRNSVLRHSKKRTRKSSVTNNSNSNSTSNTPQKPVVNSPVTTTTSTDNGRPNTFLSGGAESSTPITGEKVKSWQLEPIAPRSTTTSASASTGLELFQDKSPPSTTIQQPQFGLASTEEIIIDVDDPLPASKLAPPSPEQISAADNLTALLQPPASSNLLFSSDYQRASSKNTDNDSSKTTAPAATLLTNGSASESTEVNVNVSASASANVAALLGKTPKPDSSTTTPPKSINKPVPPNRKSSLQPSSIVNKNGDKTPTRSQANRKMSAPARSAATSGSSSTTSSTGGRLRTRRQAQRAAEAEAEAAATSRNRKNSTSAVVDENEDCGRLI